MEHIPHAFTLRFLVKLAGPVGFYKSTPLSWLCVWPCNTDKPQQTWSQSTERSRAWQRCNFPPLKAQLPPGDLYRTLQVKPSFCLQVARRKKGIRGRKKRNKLSFCPDLQPATYPWCTGWPRGVKSVWVCFPPNESGYCVQGLQGTKG